MRFWNLIVLINSFYRVANAPLFYKSNTTLVATSLYFYISTWDVVRIREKVQNHSPPARDFELFLVFFQHPA